MRLSQFARVSAGIAAAFAVSLTAPAVSVSATSEVMHQSAMHQVPVKGAKASRPRATSPLSYHGGVGGVAVETGADRVYVVEWGFNGSDPSGEVGLQTGFFSGVGGSSWNRSVTQYCQGSVVATGATSCPGGATFATNPGGVYSGLWVDNTNPVPGSITQSSLANEAVLAAAHFGNNTAASNTTAQYVIDTPHGHSMSGFGTQWCAWHSSTSSSAGNIAYTNFPYITDAGQACGANAVNSGSAGLTDGITIVGGHEFAETETDIFPNGGWLDSRGSENGDKCAWLTSGSGAMTNISLSTGSYPVQSLWSNAANGCVVSS